MPAAVAPLCQLMLFPLCSSPLPLLFRQSLYFIVAVHVVSPSAIIVPPDAVSVVIIDITVVVSTSPGTRCRYPCSSVQFWIGRQRCHKYLGLHVTLKTAGVLVGEDAE